MDFSLMKPVFEKYKDEKGSLITILQRAQELYGWLSPELLTYISEETGAEPMKIIGASTFYAQFRLKPVGKHLILLCQGTACHVNGSAEIERAIKEYLGVNEGEITSDGLFTYNNAACLGCCSLSPVMTVDDEAFGKLTGEKAVKILEEIKAGEAR